MKKRVLLSIVCILLTLLCSVAFAEAENPVVFYQGNTVAAPGDAIGIRGEYLDQKWTATITDGAKTEKIDLIQQDRQSFKFVIPKDFAKGLYTLTLEGEKPLTVTINTPVVRWMQGDQGAVATNGGWVRVQGECLRITDDANITLTLKAADGKETVLTPERVYDDYSIGFAVGDLPHGDYAATYANGFASCDAGTLTVGDDPMAKYPKDVFNVVEFGLDNTGVEDCTAKLRALMMKVEANGGGVVYFPKGRYRLKNTFGIPKGVVIKGDGADYTQIFWEDVWRSLGFDEKMQITYLPDNLPEAMMISDEGDFVIEDIEFYAGRIGEWLHIGANKSTNLVEGNATIRNVRVFQNSNLGVDWSHTLITEKIYMGEVDANHYGEHWREIISINAKTNIQFIGCDFTWGGDKFFDEAGYIEYLLVQDCTLEGPWLTFGVEKGIIEDVVVDGSTWGLAGNNIYIARIESGNTEGGDKEAFTTDGASALPYYGTAEISEDGMTYTFPKGTDMSRVDTRCYVAILSGKGAGQSRKISSIKGTTVTIEEPFAVAPDADSIITANFAFANWYMVDMAFENAGRFQFYVATQNVVVDGASFQRTAGLKVVGQPVYSSYGINWYMSFVNCDFSDGNYYHNSGWSDYHYGIWINGLYASMGAPTEAGNYRRETIPGYSQLYLYCTTPDLGTLSTTFRNNTLRDGCVILLVSEGEGADKNISDAIIDSNTVENNDVGIYIHGEIGGLYIQDNVFTNVKTEIQQVESWIYEGDFDYYDKHWGDTAKREAEAAALAAAEAAAQAAVPTPAPRTTRPGVTPNWTSAEEVSPAMIQITCTCGNPDHVLPTRGYYQTGAWEWNEADWRWECDVTIYPAVALADAASWGAKELEGASAFTTRFYWNTEKGRFHVAPGYSDVWYVTCPKGPAKYQPEAQPLVTATPEPPKSNVRPTRATIRYMNVPSSASNPNVGMYFDGYDDIVLQPLDVVGFRGWADKDGNPLTVLETGDMESHVVYAVIDEKPAEGLTHLKVYQPVMVLQCKDHPEHRVETNYIMRQSWQPWQSGGWDYEREVWGWSATLHMNTPGNLLPGHTVVGEIGSIHMYYDVANDQWLPSQLYQPKGTGEWLPYEGLWVVTMTCEQTE